MPTASIKTYLVLFCFTLYAHPSPAAEPESQFNNSATIEPTYQPSPAPPFDLESQPKGSAAPVESQPKNSASTAGNLAAPVELQDILNFVQLESVGFFKISERQSPNALSFSYDTRRLRLQGVRDLAELLQIYSPAANIGVHERTGPLIGMRGVMVDNNAKTLVLLDGALLNRRNHFGYLGANLLSPLLGDTEALEVVVGPGSLVHGSGAINGLILMKSPTGTSREGLWVSGALASGFQRIGEISVGQVFDRVKGIDLFTYVGVASSEGVTPLPVLNAPQAFWRFERVNAYDTPHIKTFTRFRMGRDVDLVQLDASLRWSDTSLRAATVSALNTCTTPGTSCVNGIALPGGAAPSGNAQDGSLRARSLLFHPKLTFTFTEHESLVLTGALRAETVDIAPAKWLLDEANRVSPNNGMYMGFTNDHSQNFETEVSGQAVFKTTSINHVQLAAGVSLAKRRFGIDSPLWSVAGGEPLRFETASSAGVLESASFAEGIIDWNQLVINLGLRYDNASFDPYTVNDLDITGLKIKPVGSWSPRVALAWQFFETQSLRVSYQRAFRYPDAAYYAWLLYFNRLYGSIVTLPSLKPETAQVFELAYRYEDVIDVKGLQFDLVASYNILQNTLGWNWWMATRPNDFATITAAIPSPGWWGSFSNETQTVGALGLDAGVRYEHGPFHSGIWYDFSRPITHRANEDSLLATWDGQAWIAYPAHMVKANVAVEVKKWTFSIAAQVRSGAQSKGSATHSMSNPQSLPPSERNPAYAQVRVNAAVAYHVTEALDIILLGKNLTFNRVRDLPYTSAAPQTPGMIGATPFVGVVAEFKTTLPDTYTTGAAQKNAT